MASIQLVRTLKALSAAAALASCSSVSGGTGDSATAGEQVAIGGREATSPTDPQRLERLAAQLGASRDWVKTLGSQRALMPQSLTGAPYTIALQDALVGARGTKYLVVGKIADMWRRSSQIVVELQDVAVFDATFEITCGLAEQVVTSRASKGIPLTPDQEADPVFALVADSLQVLRTDREIVEIDDQSTGEHVSVSAEPRRRWVITGRCAGIQKL